MAYFCELDGLQETLTTLMSLHGAPFFKNSIVISKYLEETKNYFKKMIPERLQCGIPKSLSLFWVTI